MSLSNKQITSLLAMIATTREDVLGCDDCYAQIAEFAEIELAGREIPDALRAVATHLQQCRCCQLEFNSLMIALRELQNRMHETSNR